MTDPDIPPGLRAAADQEYAQATTILNKTVAVTKDQLADGKSPLEAWALTAAMVEKAVAGRDGIAALAHAISVVAAACVDLAQRQADDDQLGSSTLAT